MPQGPVRATHEFGLLRRASSLEVIPSQTPNVSKIDKKIKRHKRSSSLGTTELKEKLRRTLQREKKQSPSPTVHGGLHNIRDALYRNSDQCFVNPSIPVFGLTRTRSLDCLSELENLTINHSPLTPHEGHKAPLPRGSRSDTPVLCSAGRCTSSQTPEDTVSPPSSSPNCYTDARSPSMDSPDKIIGSSPRVNCSFLFARQPPPNADKARCIKGSSLESLERSGPDKSKIKIIFSNNSVFNRPPPPRCVTRHSPAEQACQ